MRETRNTIKYILNAGEWDGIFFGAVFTATFKPARPAGACFLARKIWFLASEQRTCDIDTFLKNENGIIHLITLKNGNFIYSRKILKGTVTRDHIELRQ